LDNEEFELSSEEEVRILNMFIIHEILLTL
jgi:hypothetical protein